MRYFPLSGLLWRQCDILADISCRLQTFDSFGHYSWMCILLHAWHLYESISRFFAHILHQPIVCTNASPSLFSSLALHYWAFTRTKAGCWILRPVLWWSRPECSSHDVLAFLASDLLNSKYQQMETTHEYLTRFVSWPYWRPWFTATANLVLLLVFCPSLFNIYPSGAKPPHLVYILFLFSIFFTFLLRDTQETLMLIFLNMSFV